MDVKQQGWDKEDGTREKKKPRQNGSNGNGNGEIGDRDGCVQSDENSINQMAIIILQFYYYYLCHIFFPALPSDICMRDSESTQKAHTHIPICMPRFTGFIVIFMEQVHLKLVQNTQLTTSITTTENKLKK